MARPRASQASAERSSAGTCSSCARQWFARLRKLEDDSGATATGFAGTGYIGPGGVGLKHVLSPILTRVSSLTKRAACALALAAVFALTATGCDTPFSASSATVYQVPESIASDCSTDVTRPLLALIALLPNNSTLSFATDACYRIEGTLELKNRSGLDFDGNGATFRSMNPPTDQRALWRFIDSKHIALHDMTVDGSYEKGGTFTARLQHAHAIDVLGSSIDVGNVTMTDVAGDCVHFGRGPMIVLTLASGTVHDSSCKRTGRNAIAVVAGDNILVQHVTTGSIGYDVFDIEPNLDSGWGSNGVTFDGNTIGSYAENAYSVVEGAPISNQFFLNNHVVGQGLKVAIADPAGVGYRPQNITISGNSSDTPQAPAAINVDHVDGLNVTGNIIPMTGGPMSAVTGSCGLRISDNIYSGGSTEALVYPSICFFTPARGEPGTTVTVTGSGFNRAGAVAVNGTPASFRLKSSSRITLVVPRRAASGPISVTAPNGTVTSVANFTVAPAP
jgi:IPT/TIG domain